jgi:hypothetical protein
MSRGDDKMMNIRKYHRGIFAGLLIIALGACADIIRPETGPEGAIPKGMGLARISLDGTGERTAVPTANYFTLDFTAAGKNAVSRTLEGGLTLRVALEPGDWNLEVKGYADSSDTTTPLAMGSVIGSITAGTETNFEVWLLPNVGSGGTGNLDYSVSFPASTRGIFTLYPMDATPGNGREIVISDSGTASSGERETAVGTLSLAEGFYRAVLSFYDGANNRAAVSTEVVHIHKDLSTPLNRTFAMVDFAECPLAAGENETTLEAKLDTALSFFTGAYTITLNGRETDLASFSPKTLTVTGNKDLIITIRGNGKTVQLGSTGSLFTLGADPGSSLTLEIQDLILQGRNDNTAPLVKVNSGATLGMKDASLITGNSGAESGGGVYVDNGAFVMSGGRVSGNSASYGGGVYVAENGTFAMSGGAVSGNTSSSASGGGVYVSGVFAMSGGAVNGNALPSGTSGYGKEVLVDGIFKMSGEARPERVFLSSKTRFIEINGPLNGPVIPIDLGVTGSASLTDYVDMPILKLDDSYSAGNLADLKAFFILGKSTMTVSPYTEGAITVNEISDGGLFIASIVPTTNISGIAYTDVSGGAWLEADGRRRSPAISNNDTAKSKVSFTSDAANAVITIQLEVSSELGCDYAFISALDNDSATYAGGYYSSSSRISGETSVTVSIPVPEAGSHFVEIGYRKDGSINSGSDCAWYKVVE